MRASLARVTQECLAVLGRPSEDAESLMWFSSGTAALTAALRAARRLQGSHRDSRVLVPAIVCPQVYLAVLGAGLNPVFVGSDAMDGDYGLDLLALEEFPADGAIALVWVHQYGCVSQADALTELCRRKGWVLVEDAALAFGVQAGGNATGTIGDCGILSFGTGKVIGAGYGGAVLLNVSPAADALAPLLLDEWAILNRLPEVDTSPIAEFDGDLKRAYNTRYADFRAGRCAAQLFPKLSNCVSRVRPLNVDLLNRVLPPGALLGAPSCVARRNDRAAWWAERFAHARPPFIKVIQHPAGTYWRLNVVVDASVRHAILRAGLAAGLPVSSWFPPLYWLAPEATVIGNTTPERTFADGVLNLWVDGVEDWDGYATGIDKLFERTLVEAGEGSHEPGDWT